MSMCIQHCWLYGSFVRGSMNLCQGAGGGGPKKPLIIFFRHQLILKFYRGGSKVYFKENYIFSGGWEVGSGPLDLRMRMIDQLTSSVKSIPKDRFSHAMVHFPLLERLMCVQEFSEQRFFAFISLCAD